jgi:hypothetical protein
LHIQLSWTVILSIAAIYALLAVLLGSAHRSRNLWLITAVTSATFTACLLLMRHQLGYTETPLMVDVLSGLVPPWAVSGFVIWLERAHYSRVLQFLGGICCFVVGFLVAGVLGLVISG